MVDTTKEQLRKYEDCYGRVLALYAMLKSGATMQIRRAQLKQGVVAAEPVDFCADCEIRAAQEMHWSTERHLWGLVAKTPENYDLFPQHLKQRLGKAFLLNSLDIDGDYRMLYYRIKNKKEPEHVADEGLGDDQT